LDTERPSTLPIQAVPVASYDSQMSAGEACGSVSDQKGDVLFYTNGMTIWNREHQQMQNGTGLSGTLSSQQLAIVQHPGNPNQYYIWGQKVCMLLIW
jgi:hypothetical protein